MIVERDEILATIKDRLDQAERGTGSFVLVGGEAGSGKTTVLREVVARCRDSLAVAWGACDPLTTARPLGPFLEIADHPELRLNHLVGADRPAAELSSALVDELANAPGALLVVVEDLHWADDGTLDMIRYLGRRVDRTRAVVLASYRNDEIAESHRLVPVLGQLRRMESIVHVETRPLSLVAVRQLVDEAGVDVDAALVHRRTGGNAFFVTEVLAGERSSSEVPGNVQAAVRARIAGFDPRTRRLIEAVAISPRALEYDHALVLSAADDEAVDEATTSGVLSVDRGRLEFRHELARLTVEQAIPAGRRRRYHRALVDRLIMADETTDGATTTDVSRIAHHAIELGDEQLVLRYGIRAADTAEASGANREACQFLAHALRFADSADPKTVTGWRIRLGSLLRLIGDLTAAIGELEQAVDECGRRSDDVGRAAALRLLSGAHRDGGERGKAEELADRAMAAAEASGDRSALAEALTQSAFLAMLARRSRTAAELAARGFTVAEASGDRAAAADAEHALACANLIGGDEAGAIDHLTHLERQAADHDDRARQSRIAVNLGSGCGEVRRYVESVPWLETAERLAVSIDMDQSASYSAAWLARVAFETGRWDDVATHVRRALGDVESAIDGPDGPSGSSFAEVTALGALGRTRVRRGDPGGHEALVKAMELAADHDVQYLWPVACGLAEDSLWRGDPEEGLAWLTPIHDQARQTESTWGRGETSYWMWRLDGLDNPPADLVAEPFALAMARHWAEAAEVWETLGCPYEQALAFLDSGQREPTGRAISILDSLGARPAAQFARQRLRELGERSVPAMPRTSTAANPGSLTNRQREVLELLVGGMSNREIAERLFVSKKTVEHHVSAVYGKLGVSDRPSAMIAGRALIGEHTARNSTGSTPTTTPKPGQQR